MDALRVVASGVTGRMGRARHLLGALAPFGREGVDLDGQRRQVEVTLVGRDLDVVRRLAHETGAAGATDDLEAALSASPDLFFDASRPDIRPERLFAAIAYGCHLYCEKPVALDSQLVTELRTAARKRDLITGVVQDKLFTPGFRALANVIAEGRLGRVLDVEGDFGYFVHDGSVTAAERPSWNFRREMGGSFVPDLFTHWAYMLELVARPVSVQALAATHVTNRYDERGDAFPVDVPDLTHVLVQLEGGITARISSSWVRRPPIAFTMSVHGDAASATASPQACALSTCSDVSAPGGGAVAAPRESVDAEVVDEFRAQWLEHLRHVVRRNDPPWSFAAAARAAAFCWAIEESARTGRRVAVPSSESEDTCDRSR